MVVDAGDCYPQTAIRSVAAATLLFDALNGRREAWETNPRMRFYLAGFLSSGKEERHEPRRNLGQVGPSHPHSCLIPMGRQASARCRDHRRTRRLAKAGCRRHQRQRLRCRRRYGLLDPSTAVLALREYLRRPGATKCNATIFPGIELRMVSPGSFRLNMHVLLNPELSDDKLHAFRAQLKLSLGGKPLTDSYLVEWARQNLTDERLSAIGTSRASLNGDDGIALQAGSKCAEVTAESVGEALRTFGERDAILFVPFDTSDGVNKIRFRASTTRSHAKCLRWRPYSRWPARPPGTLSTA